jgi:O-antigen ligase
LLPVQVGKHFWPVESFVRGIRIDYLSPTLYALDILIILFLVSFLPLASIATVKALVSKNKIQLLLLTVIFVTSLTVAENKVVTVYGIARIIELILFGIGAKIFLQREGSAALARLGLVFAIGVLYSSSIAISQLLKQGSVGGLLYFIGERSFSSETPGIANAAINGMLIMRPYAAFPHPNVLAWYLLIGTAFCIAAFFLRKKYRLSQVALSIIILGSALGSLTIFLTLSRSVILVFILFILVIPPIFIKTFKRKMLICFYSSMTILLIGLYFLTPLGGRIEPLLHSDKAFVDRAMLFSSAWGMYASHPIVGVGINNYLVELPQYYPLPHVMMQPVHNIYMLTLVEIGVVGFILLMYTLIRAGLAAYTIKNVQLRLTMLFLLLSAVVLGLVDHYMLTLEQGQILFVFLIACCFGWQHTGKSTNKKTKKI